jgi:hypothetical protein
LKDAGGVDLALGMPTKVLIGNFEQKLSGDCHEPWHLGVSNN